MEITAWCNGGNNNNDGDVIRLHTALQRNAFIWKYCEIYPFTQGHCYFEFEKNLKTFQYHFDKTDKRKPEHVRCS